MKTRAAAALRGAHASRMLATASRRRELSAAFQFREVAVHGPVYQVRLGETPRPTRGTRVLPGVRSDAITDPEYA